MPTSTWHRLPEHRRQAVIDAAQAEFAAHGYSAGSLNVIARKARVAKGSLFQYFHDKLDLYAHISDLESEQIRATIQARIAGLPWADRFWACCRAAVDIWVDYFVGNSVYIGTTAALAAEPDTHARTTVRGNIDHQYAEVIRPIVDFGKANGDIRADADTDVLLSMLVLLLPNVALGPGSPALMPIFKPAPDEDAVRALRAGVHRMLDVLEASFGTDPGSLERYGRPDPVEPAFVAVQERPLPRMRAETAVLTTADATG